MTDKMMNHNSHSFERVFPTLKPNSADPDQTAPLGLIWVGTICLKAFCASQKTKMAELLPLYMYPFNLSVIYVM